MKKLILLGAASLFFISNTNAQCRTGAKQTCSVHHVKYTKGNITPREKAAIARQQHDVRLAQRVAASDGVITPRERRIIQQQKRQVKATAYRAKNNGR